MAVNLRSYISKEFLQRRSFGIVFVILGLIALVRLAEVATLSYISSQWDLIVEKKSVQQIRAVSTAFTTIQRKVRRVASELARDQLVASYLSGKSADVVSVFRQAKRIAENQDVAIEVYDTNAVLVAWSGRSDVVNRAEIALALRGVLTSYVTRGPIYSQLFVISPVRVEGAIHGVILVRQTVEVNYPLSNKFIQRAGVAEQLSRVLGVTVEISYGESAELRKDGRYVSSELTGIDGRKLGVVSILRAGRSAYMENVSLQFQRANAFLFLLLLGMCVLICLGRIRAQNSVVAQFIAITAIIWLVRYALLWLEIPSVFYNAEVFNPGHFASKFAGGLAKSAGEMFLTSIALALTVNVMLRTFFKREGSDRTTMQSMRLPFRVIIGVFVTTFIFLLLRGYAAVVRSSVFDSTLRFNDPTVIIPSVELGFMFFNLLVMSSCLIIVALMLTLLLLRLFEKEEARQSYASWLIVLGLFALASVLFGIVQETPLMSTQFRFLFGATMLLFGLRIRLRNGRRRSLLNYSTLSLVLVLSALFFYPLLDDAIHEKDRGRIEAFAREVVRPADAWLKFIVDESLQRLSSDDAIDVLRTEMPGAIDRLAFTCWAGSVAATQGYNCAFVILSPHREEMSRFAIGVQSVEMAQALDSTTLRDAKVVEIREIGSGINAVKVYSGSVPIASHGQVLGYGLVVISAAQQSLFRGETPSVFRSVSQENLESFYRPIIVTEFVDDVAFSSTGEGVPIGYPMPPAVRDRFRNTSSVFEWSEGLIDDREFETLYARRAPGDRRVVGLMVEQLGNTWHLFGVVRTLAFFFIIAVIILPLVLIAMKLRGIPYHVTFRDTLLGAMVVTAAIPMVLIAIFSRTFARERLIEELSQQLNREIVVVEERLLSSETDTTLTIGSRSSAEQLAASMRADFNYYAPIVLAMSSRPELYDTGILDRRLPGSVYANLFVKGKQFHLQTENIGSYQYAVGYRAVQDQGGKIRGVISVPTLYRQDQIDREVAQTNAVLFGIFSVLLIVIVLLATTLANRIASPIHKLTEATKRVALGDLNVRVNDRAEGEIGELIRSFESMTKDLKNSRENLVQYERELAWKEMAKQVAHEIKNPLTPMKLALQHLRQTYKDRVDNFDEVFDEVSQMVIRQVDALSRIASEFSSFARMPHARLEKCSVNDVLREAVHLFEQDVRVRFDAHLDAHLPPIMADREELRRAFINIMRNGIQAMNNEGRLVVQTRLAGTEIEIRIQDFGSGISDAIKGKLFQPNFSTKTDGMGLGLAIVKKTIEDLHGSIVMESELNKGTTVIINIPVHPSSHEPTGTTSF